MIIVPPQWLAAQLQFPYQLAVLSPLAEPPQAASALKSRRALEQASAALRAGNPVNAEWILRQRIFEQADDAGALTKLAEIVLGRDQIEEATILLRRAAAAEPIPERQLTLIRHLQQHVGAPPVLEQIHRLPPAIRSLPEVQAIEAAMHGFLGDHDRQITIYESLTSQAPRNAALWKTLGDALKTVGRTDEAIGAVRRALEINPHYGEAWWTLANFKSYRFTGRDICTMRKALRGKLPDVDALHFHFALGQAFEDRNEFAKSFRHYEAGNSIRRKGIAPAAMRVTNYIDRAIATYTPEFFERHKRDGDQDQKPIFVLGLHRSGSTLIEQILGNHPLIEATTEINIMHQIWLRIERTAARSGRDAFQEIRRFASSEFAVIGRDYLERSGAFRATDKPYFVDKLPANWMYVGLIRLALPHAAIIDARRHPMACGFSNFKQNYAEGMTFSYSLESIGAFYRDYWRFMRHIDAVQPGAVHRVVNEHLIDDPAGEVRKMLDFIGLPFDPACLEFHKSKRPIGTPSAEQIRKGIGREGVDQWRNYEQWLGPLKVALGEALENWDKQSG